MMETATAEISEDLIYEVLNGKPIYYKNYQEVLNGNQRALFANCP